MNRFAHLSVMSAMIISLAACGENAEEKGSASHTGMETETEDGAINNVIDCAQYPIADAQRYAEEYFPDCRQWAQSQGYSDGVVLPMDTAAKEIELSSDSLTCPEVKAGNAGYYCIGLYKLTQ